jgi:hypothetical protein|tara:strand:- start:1332 stop:1754 length:423 start_codon:yes stop_codon:yes gene_type:complete
MAKLGGQAGYSVGHFVENISAAKTLTTGDSGKVFTITQSSAFAISLPKAADAGVGWNAKFLITTAGSFAITIEPDSTEDTLIGMVVMADDGTAGASSESGVDTLTFISGAAAGDWVDLLCDGSNFYVSGMMHDNNHITIA